MPEELENTYRKARRASLFGAVCMHTIATLSALNSLSMIIALLSKSSGESSPFPLEELIASISTVLTTISIVLLGEFLRRFGSDRSPFGKKQSYRLLAAGVLFAGRMAFDSIASLSNLSLGAEGENAAVWVTTQPGPDLKVIVMIVFLICLAMVVRYGDALKEDSDSIA